MLDFCYDDLFFFCVFRSKYFDICINMIDDEESGVVSFFELMSIINFWLVNKVKKFKLIMDGNLEENVVNKSVKKLFMIGKEVILLVIVM